jgi:Caspase domain
MTIDGAEVIRLRSTEQAPVSGHALLIGAPLGKLRRVGECLQAMQGWLEQRGWKLIERGHPTAAGIEHHMNALIGDVQRGDFVLVYYAGHGIQVVGENVTQEPPVVVQVPMDAYEAKTVIPGDEWLRWMKELAHKADTQGRNAAGVTVILECCHSQGLLEQWSEETRRKVMQRLRQRLEHGPRVRGVDPLEGVVRVFASGRDENARVGALTFALLKLWEEHPGEPWWALMDRVHAGWELADQSPGLAGLVERVPLSKDRLKRPEGLLPVVWKDEAWQLPHRQASGWLPGQRVGLTTSLGLPAHAQTRLEPGGTRLRVVEPAGGWRGDGFAWACAAPRRGQAIVGVGGVEPQLGVALRRLSPLVKVRPLPEAALTGPSKHDVRFWVRADGMVEIIDRVGDTVACTSLVADETWAAWIDRLIALEQWLAVAERMAWRPRGLEVQWGCWVNGERVAWVAGPRAIAVGVPMWIEVKVDESEHAFATVFRVRADRAVEELTAYMPGGLPLTGQSPVATLGTPQHTLELTWPDGLRGSKRTEWLVVIVSQQPVPLSALARSVVGSPAPEMPAVMRGGTLAGGGNRELAMLVREYWVERAPEVVTSGVGGPLADEGTLCAPSCGRTC